jgi:serine/threonine protein kinase
MALPTKGMETSKYRSRSMSADSDTHADQCTPRERQPAGNQCRSGIHDLKEMLARLSKNDLEALTRIRDTLDARCQELAAATEQKQAAASLDLVGVACVKDASIMPTSIGDWDIGREIGAGCYAKVFSAKNRSTGVMTAAKVVEKGKVSNDDDWQNLCNEHDALRKVGRHANIAWLAEALQSEMRLYFFLDFVRGKELFEFLKLRQQNKTPVAKPAVEQISSSISAALSHIHACGICHRDIKPENIIIQQDYVAKLVDFGCACPRLELQPECVGTLPFIAPEFLMGTAHDGAPADIWSFGVVMLEMFSGLRIMSKALGWDTQETPMKECGSMLSALFADPLRGLVQVRSHVGTDKCSENDKLLASMLDAAPAQRPTAETLCKASWFNQPTTAK